MGEAGTDEAPKPVRVADPRDVEAARELSNLTGLDLRHFRYRGGPTDRSFGGHAVTSGCEILNVFDPAGPGNGPHARDRKLHQRIHRAYRHKTWIAHYKALNAAFLAHEGDRRIPSPLSGGEATILGSVTIAQYQVTPCLDDGRLIVFIGIGYMPVGILYPAENLFTVLTNFVLFIPAVLRAFLDQFTSRPRLWAEWLRRARAGGLRRAFVLGDNRPSHFVRQSLAYLDVEEAAVLDFAGRGGLLVEVSDLCAMDPFEIFPALAPLERLSVRSERLMETILADGLDAHRVYRFNIHPDAAWLRRRLAPVISAALEAAAARDGRRYRVMISLDAERERVLNAVEAFRFTLRKLGEACAAEGTVLDVVWDGWTVPGVPGPKDVVVMERIEAMIAAITEGLEVPLGEQVRIFDRSSLAKVPDLARCDLALTTQGTGAQVSSWLLQRPTIVYHVASATSNRSYLDDASAIDMDPRAVDELPPGDVRAANHQRFSLALWGLEDALRRALAGRLAIRPECPPPEAAQA